MTTIAVMQPYFMPYAGYFRLFAAADCVAFFDCVQFPRRGWVHRNRLPDASGAAVWLTLPLTSAPVETAIRDLRFAPDAAQRFGAQTRRFPSLVNSEHPLVQDVLRVDGTVCDYLERTLRYCCSILGLPFRTVRTSSLSLDPGLHGQARVLAAARALGADTYVNLEGGRGLYDPTAFDGESIRLRILPQWQGSSWSMLHRLLTEPAAAVAAEIHGQL